MTKQDFSIFQNDVEGTSVSFANQLDGTTIVTCSDGVRILVTADGDSRPVQGDENDRLINARV